MQSASTVYFDPPLNSPLVMYAKGQTHGLNMYMKFMHTMLYELHYYYAFVIVNSTSHKALSALSLLNR